MTRFIRTTFLSNPHASFARLVVTEWINLSAEAYQERNSAGVWLDVTRAISIRIWEGLKIARSDSGVEGIVGIRENSGICVANREKRQVVSCRGGRRFTLSARSFLVTRKPKWRYRAAFIVALFLFFLFRFESNACCVSWINQSAALLANVSISFRKIWI